MRAKWTVGLCLALALLVCGGHAQAASRAMCPDKVIDTNTIIGTYMGWFESEEGLFAVGIQVQDEPDPVYLGASEEDARKYFGETTGQRVSATYQVEQFFVEETRECVRLEMLTAGHVLKAPKGAAQSAVAPGRYVYREEGSSGELRISAPDASGKIPVAIETVNDTALHTCDFEGLCTARGNELICRPSPDTEPEDTETFVGIRVLPQGLEVFQQDRSWCGMKASMLGRYVKR